MLRKPGDKPRTLSDADISSQRVSRRTLLTTLVGIGTGVAAGVVAGLAANRPAMARQSGKMQDVLISDWGGPHLGPSPKKGLRGNRQSGAPTKKTRRRR